jgi:hypothetical protein
MTLLITSIPPSIKRVNRYGAEIGRKYQSECIESWKRAGFLPLSVNSSSERVVDLCHTTLVHRDASRLTGRPHVFIADLLSVACEHAGGKPFVIINSDLIVRDNVARLVENIQPGEFLYSRRIEIHDPSETTGESYRNGFDFFACHPSDAAKFKTSLVFGVPWWDHLLPLIAYKNRCLLHQIKTPLVLHLEHRDRWHWNLWKLFGERFLRDVYDRSSSDAYQKTLEGVVTMNPTFTVLGKRFRVGRLLTSLTEMNIKFLDELAVVQDSPSASMRPIT